MLLDNCATVLKIGSDWNLLHLLHIFLCEMRQLVDAEAACDTFFDAQSEVTFWFKIWTGNQKGVGWKPARAWATMTLLNLTRDRPCNKQGIFLDNNDYSVTHINRWGVWYRCGSAFLWWQCFWESVGVFVQMLRSKHEQPFCCRPPHTLSCVPPAAFL